MNAIFVIIFDSRQWSGQHVPKALYVAPPVLNAGREADFAAGQLCLSSLLSVG
jgi:hypothetical protein